MNKMISIKLLSASLFLLGACTIGEHTGSGGGTGVEGLSGVLVRPNGSPVANAWVKVYTPASLTKQSVRGSNAGEGFLDLAKLASHTVQAIDSVRTSATGQFNIPGLVSGTYALSATHSQDDSTYSLWMEGVIVTGRTDLGVDTLRLAGKITMQIEANGVPVEGATCFLESTPFGAHTDSSGVCSLEGLPPGTFDIVISYGNSDLGVIGDLQVLSGILLNKGVLNLVSGQNLLPPKPALLSPADSGIVAITDTLLWSAVSGASNYNLQIWPASEPLMANPVVNDSSLTGIYRTIGNLTKGAAYNWRVRARNATGYGQWSDVRLFHVRNDSSSTTQSRFAIKPSTVVLWTFDSIDAQNRFVDISGNGHHLPAPSNANIFESPHGKAAYYNGGISSLSGASAPSLANYPRLTIEARIWLDEYPSASLWNQSAILIGQYSGIKLFINSQGQIGAASQSGNGVSWQWYSPRSVAGAVPLGRWVDVAIAAERDSALLYTYVDGVPVQTYSDLASGSLLRPSASTDFPFAIGNDTRDHQPFLGRIDEIRVSNELVLGKGPKVIVGPTPAGL